MMLTIFAAPKRATGLFATAQRNAVRSWKALRPEPEIILFGSEEGTKELADEVGCRHLPEIARNEYGTPLLSSLFAEAEKAAAYPLLCYANADVILMSDFSRAVEQVSRTKEQFLMISHRIEVDLVEAWDFSRADWEEQLRSYVARHGKLLRVDSSDYFVFSRGLFKEIPPFAIGRNAWDNWLIYAGRSLKIPVIDATPVVTAIHHTHDYSHHPQGLAGVRRGLEAQRNNELYGSRPCYGLYDATHRLTPEGLRVAWGRGYLIARLSKFQATKALLDVALRVRQAWREGLGSKKA